MEILEFKKLDLSEYKSLGDFDIKRIDKNILIIYKDHKYGLLSLDGKIIKKPTFANIEDFKDELALVQYCEPPEFGVINSNGDEILISPFKFTIEDKYIVEEALWHENKYTIFYKDGKKLFHNIDNYYEDLFIIRKYGSFNYYDVIDVNNKKITSIRKHYDKETLQKKGILKYNSKDNINVIEPITHKIRKFKCKDLKIINSNRYLQLNKNNLWQIIDSKGKVIKDIDSNIILEIDKYEIILKRDNNNYLGFIKQTPENIETTDIIFDSYEIVSNNRIIICSKNNYALLDLSGNLLIPYTDYKITYDYNSNCYILNKNNKYIVLTEELDKIYECDNKDLKVISKDLFLIKDNQVLLVNSNNEVLKTFNDEINDIKIIAKGNLISINTKNIHTLITKNKVELIPEIDDDIVIIDENRIAVNNCIINLNNEFINLKVNYIVKISLFEKDIVRKFSSIKDKDLFINHALKMEKEYYNKINQLESDTIDNINNACEKIKRKKYKNYLK